MRLLTALLLMVLCVALTGCPAASHRESGPYLGPTQSMAQVVADINENNRKIPSLWSSLYYKANIVDDRKHAHFINGEGHLLYRQPGDLRLIGTKDPAGIVFDIGSNRDSYWLRVIPELSTMWYGRYDQLETADLNAMHIPIRPDLVLGVLTVSTIDTNFNALPTPTMRFNSQADAYMFVWITKAPDRFVAFREVWYDRATRRPKFVLLYDGNGRVALRADLGMFKQLEIAGQDKSQWPTLPTDYTLTFPDSGSSMEFTLSDDLTLRNDNAPNDKSFQLPDPEKAGVDHAVRIGG